MQVPLRNITFSIWEELN